MRSLFVALVVLTTLCVASEALNPIVFFPGYSLSKLAVTVKRGQIAGCPTQGSYVATFGMSATQNGFDLGCMYNYLDIIPYKSGNSEWRYRNRDDVTVTIPGREQGDVNLCVGSDAYTPMFQFFQGKGYIIGGKNANFRAACWDWRIDPSNDVIQGPSFVQNTIQVVKDAYKYGGNKKVYLIAHSNGPMMTLHFLNSVSDDFKRRYIAGFISLDGNFAGQGLFIGVFLQGFRVTDFNFDLATVPVQPHWTQNYFSLPQPDVFSGVNDETVLQLQSPPSTYDVSANSFDQIFTLTNNTFGLQVWRKYIGLIGPHTPPYVPTWAFWGDSVEPNTAVGLLIDNLHDNNIVDYFLKPGDTNQERTTNASPNVWNTTMPAGCYHAYPLLGLTHFQVPVDQGVLDSIWNIVSGPVPTLKCTIRRSNGGF